MTSSPSMKINKLNRAFILTIIATEILSKVVVTYWVVRAVEPEVSHTGHTSKV